MKPYPRFFSGEPPSDVKERWQWTYPIIFSPVDPNVLYTSSQHVWKTTNDGQSWTKISGDLTRARSEDHGRFGRADHARHEQPGDLRDGVCARAALVEKGLIWAGSDDGLVHVTRDGGANWTNVTPPDLGDFARVSQIEPSSFKQKAGTAYVAGKRYRCCPATARPISSGRDDYGKTWTKIVNGIAPHHYVHSVREDPTRRGLLYAGTQHGVYVSFNDGDSWQSLRLNMPDTQISDLAVKGGDLVIATHGRSFWVLDNISTLRQLTPELTSSALKVFEPRPAIRSYNRADVDYFLSAAVDRITVDIVDAQGRTVRSFTQTAAEEQEREKQPAAGGGGGGFGGPPQLPPSTKAGMNRFSWNLRHAGATVFPGMITWGGNPANGPMAVPGTYQVRVTAGSQTQTVPLQVQKHPLYENVSVADLQQQLDFAIEIRDRTSDANEAVVQIRDVKAQIKERVEQSKNPRLKEIGDLVTQKLSAIEEEVYQVRNRSGQDPLNFPIKVNNRLAALRRSVETGDAAPTDASREIYKMLSADLQKQLDALAAVTKGDLANFNKAAAQQKLPAVAPKPVERAK